MSNDPFPNEPQNHPPSEQPGSQPGASPSGSNPPGMDWREMRHAARQARIEQRRMWRAGVYGRYGSGWGWAFGAVLVLIGLAFLIQNMTGYYLANWWALFILIPAFGSLGAAWNIYRGERRFTWFARSSLITGIILTFIALGFLFAVNLTIVGPIFLIVAGIAILVTALIPG